MQLKEFVQTFTCVKSLLTLALTGCFIFEVVTGAISSENFMTIFSMVISFYFGSQWEKKKTREEHKNDKE